VTRVDPRHFTPGIKELNGTFEPPEHGSPVADMALASQTPIA
jgi:hypothetical protein